MTKFWKFWPELRGNVWGNEDPPRGRFKRSRKQKLQNPRYIVVSTEKRNKILPPRAFSMVAQNLKSPNLITFAIHFRSCDTPCGGFHVIFPMETQTHDSHRLHPAPVDSGVCNECIGYPAFGQFRGTTRKTMSPTFVCICRTRHRPHDLFA